MSPGKLLGRHRRVKRARWSPVSERSRAHYVDGHHIRHWIDGGETSLENTTLLCTHHHTLLHEGGFTIERDGRGALSFRRPDARVMPRGGYPVEDMVDDGIGAEGADLDRAVAEARMGAITQPSARHATPGEPEGTQRATQPSA